MANLPRLSARIACLALIVLACRTAGAQDLRSVPIARFGTISPSQGGRNIATTDINADGVADIISCSNGAPFVLARNTASAFAPIWMGPSIGCTASAVGDVNGDGATDIAVVTSGSPGNLVIFSPPNLAAIATVPLPGSAQGADVAIGNVDNDPELEIVATTNAATYVFNGATLQLEWTASGFSGTQVKLGDVNGDGRKDIVVNGSTGYVLNGQTHQLIFGYLGGFGYSMAAGDIDNDGKAEIVFTASYGSNVTIVEGDTQTTHTIPVTSGNAIDTVGIADVTGDGKPEILTGNNQWGEVAALRPSDGARLWFFNTPGYGSTSITAADVDGNGSAEVIWFTGMLSSGGNLYIVDVPSKTTLWSSGSWASPSATAVGDLDGDGRLEVAVVTAAYGGYGGGTIQIYDVLTGALEWTLNSQQNLTRVAIGQVDGDAAKEIVALAYNSYQSQILVWDGVNHQLEFSSTAFPCCGGPYLTGSALVVANVDNDPVDEIIVGESDSKILIFNGASNFVQMLLPVSGTPRDFTLADLNNDGIPELVVATSMTLYSFDTANWSTLASPALPGIRRVAATAANGGTVAVSVDDSTTLRTYTGATLTPAWTCLSTAVPTPNALAFATMSGSTALLAGDANGFLRSMPAGSASCPTVSSSRPWVSEIANLSAVDLTADGRGDLFIDGATPELDLIGFAAAVNGDVDGDGFVNATDVDKVTDWLLIGPPGIDPSGDVNRDQTLDIRDALALINYQYSGGPLPP